MNVLLIADLHLTAAARDEYRWRLFPWLRENLQGAALIILGDLTDAKDYHSSKLVNRIVDELSRLETKIWIVPGNHDAVDPTCPYFRFLRHLPFVTYIETPFMTPFAGRDDVLFLPHAKEFDAWRTLLPTAQVVFMHQTVSGSVSETGYKLEGDDSWISLAKRATVWSGDVHVPQKAGIVNYVGSPYPVRFGDKFKPRAVLLSKGLREAKGLETPRFGRHHIKIFPDFTSLDPMPDMQPGDQAKFTIRLKRSEFGEWERLRKIVIKVCEEGQVELCGLDVERIEDGGVPKIPRRGEGKLIFKTPPQVLGEWCETQKLEKSLADAGQEILKTVVG